MGENPLALTCVHEDMVEILIRGIGLLLLLHISGGWRMLLVQGHYVIWMVMYM